MPPPWSVVRITPTAEKVNPMRHGNRAICTRKRHGNRAKRRIEKICRKSLDNGTATVLSSKHPKRHGNRATNLENLHGHRPGKNTGGVS